ncbi:MAG: DUF6263 family protein [Pirellulaceae bacterium]
MIFNFRFAIGSLLLLASLCHVASAETLLRWKFVEGAQWQVAVDQHTETKTTGAGKPTGIDITMQMRMTWTIDSVDSNGTAQITQRFDRFAVTMKSGAAEPIAYASDSKTKPTGSAAGIAAAVEPVLGVDFTVTMTDRGAIGDVQLSQAAREAFASVESPALQQLFSTEGISQLLRQAAVELPEQAVAEGSRWTAQFATPSPLGTLKQSRDYTVAAQEEVDGKSLERIVLAGDLVIEGGKPTAKDVKLVGQELVGTMYFDAEAGHLTRFQTTQKLTIERPYREFKIQVATTANTTTTISDL